MKLSGTLFRAIMAFIFMTAFIPEAFPASSKKIQVTVYNDNRALITEQRQISLKKGINEIRISDVPEKIQPTSVHFRSITDPKNTVVLEQNFEYDLVSTSKLYQKYIGQGIEITTKEGNTHKGTLLGMSDSLILESKNHTITVIDARNISETIFPSLPAGLITKPALMWQVQSRKRGRHDIEIAYITGGLSWSADYILLVSKDDTFADLTGWVSVINRAGTTFDNAHLKLVAGTLHKATEPREQTRLYSVVAKALPRQQEVQERALFEYHLYDIGRAVTLKNNQTKQIEFITCPKIQIQKRFVLENRNSYFVRDKGKQPIEVQIKFRNNKESGLGLPLPAGKIRIYKADIDNSVQLIGEDNITHTPKDESVSLTVGKAFDIIGKRTKVSQEALGKRSRKETWTILVRNHKDKKIEVHIVEHLSQWSEWEIIKESHKHKKVDSATIEYVVQVPADKDTSVTYTVLYRW